MRHQRENIILEIIIAHITKKKKKKKKNYIHKHKFSMHKYVNFSVVLKR